MNYTVISNLKHNGVDYKVGDVVIIENEIQAQGLIDAGVIEKAVSITEEPVEAVTEKSVEPKKGKSKK